jgi:RNA polymerase sigma factor (sigma-70 family)
MTNEFATQTSISLLGRLRQDAKDQAAWEEFVRRYGQQIYRWCRKWQLQEADAQDVTQTVLVKLAEKMRTFTYDPARSFRAYLKTLTHYAWCDFLQAHKRPGAGSGGSEVLQVLQAVEARDDLVRHLNQEFDQELLEEATARVRQRVEPHTWEAFRLTALEGLSGADAAQRLGLNVATVFKAKSKVQKMLQQEIRSLEEPGA